jgi:hypothetical protein
MFKTGKVYYAHNKGIEYKMYSMGAKGLEPLTSRM